MDNETKQQIDILKKEIQDLKSRMNHDIVRGPNGSDVLSGLLRIGPARLVAQRVGVEGVDGILLETALGSPLFSYLFSSAGFAMPGGILSGDVYPDTDNSYDLGRDDGIATQRWADVRSVLINGADIGFANGWKFREYPLKPQDVTKPSAWMKENANLGIQLLDDQDNLIAVFHRNGTLYCNDIKKLNELNG